MKRFALLGRSLSLQEQKNIIGGDDDDDRFSASCDTPKVSCFCNGVRFQCCANHIDDCLNAHSCGELYACAG